ncbi:MarR family transcriptional regulator [Asanoa sp. NPDC049518]|uniref:MarR family winged helix-turn-helix transcriptional regulator n=1 Tax=unclassified Asanoa TaxID=2685164 RepID=UPI0034431B33
MDLLDSSHWGPVWALLHGMDREIAELYAEAGIGDVRTRFVGPLIQLSRHEPLTIQELADRVRVTHSAMSQTVAAMRRSGLVDDATNVDGRTRRIQLSERGRELVPFLAAEWRATEKTVRELDAEVPYALTAVVEDLRRALEQRSFRDRLRANFSLERQDE